MMVDYASICEVGSREVNEDCIAVARKQEKYCFVVCDGLGGHGMGDLASQLVTRTFAEQFERCDSCKDFLPTAFSEAQERLTAYQKENNAANKMRTTAAVLVLDEQYAYIGHVGDSRVYVFDDNGIKRRTIDHSVPQVLALAGEITPEEIRKHPDRNRILRAMGTDWERPMFELCPTLARTACKGFLLCSDGFWEYIDEKEMQSALDGSKTAAQWLNTMQAIVEKSGKRENMDNYSAIAVLCSERSI